MGIDDAYAELGLTPTASESEVKAAWRRLAARWHPDRNPSPQAHRRMQDLNRALEAIRSGRPPAETPAPNGSEPAPARDDKDKHNEGGAARDAHAQDAGRDEQAPPGRTLHCTVRLTLEEAALGCVTELSGEVADDCPDCAASGVLEIAGGCPDCGGSGRVRRWFGWLSSEFECDACQGDGIGRQTCGACSGTGQSPPRAYRCRARIPPGVRDGDLLHVPARPARSGNPGAPGSDALELRIELLPHEFFALDADGTLSCELPVDGFDWMANRWIEVPTPGGLQQMRLDRKHLVYRLRGQGFPTRRRGPRGDCLVRIEPLFPQEPLGDELEALLDRLVAANTGDYGTPAGRRYSAWRQRLADWQARQPERAPERASERTPEDREEA